MKRSIELPLAEPMYSTYHYQGSCIAATAANPSIRNWILNEAVLLTCSRQFLSGRTTPDLDVSKSSWVDNPYFERIYYTFQYMGGYINPIIRRLLEMQYYICFCWVDDYYVKGKSWYHQQHFSHDGMICGYNQVDKTYCIYAYDRDWRYRKFWTPQRCFDKGREAIQKHGGYGEVYGIRAKPDPVAFLPETAYQNLKNYLDSSFRRYPLDGEGTVYGLVVQKYLAIYIRRLYDGSIPYDRKDRRVLRLLWEHKKVMLERMMAMEHAFGIPSGYSKQYEAIVAAANTLRMLYASYCMRKRDSVLPVLYTDLLRLHDDEERILTDFVKQLEEVIQHDEPVAQTETKHA